MKLHLPFPSNWDGGLVSKRPCKHMNLSFYLDVSCAVECSDCGETWTKSQWDNRVKV